MKKLSCLLLLVLAALFAQAPDPKPRSIAYLNPLFHYPAVPELDGTHPYEEMILAFAISPNADSNPVIAGSDPQSPYIWDCFSDHSQWQEALPLLHPQGDMVHRVFHTVIGNGTVFDRQDLHGMLSLNRSGIVDEIAN